MAAIAIRDFPARPGADRNAFLVFTALVWVAVLSGFGTDSVGHVGKYGLDYPPIVHVHAMAFVGWLVMLGLGVYDLITRRRLHPAYIAGVAWTLGLQATAVFLLQSPAWKAMAMRMIGH